MKREFLYRVGVLLSASLLSFQMWACGSGGSSTSTSSLNSAKIGATDLAVASPTASNSSSSSSLSSLRSSSIRPAMVSAAESPQNEDDIGTLDYEDKLAQLDAIRNATTLQGCFNFSATPMRSGNDTNCYGPFLGLFGTHPDGVIPSFGQMGNPLPGGDLGLWNDVTLVNNQETTEACSAAKITSVVNNATASIDNSLLFQAALQCMMRINGTALPNPGETLDLTSAVSSIMSNFEQAPTMSSVTLRRQNDDNLGNPIYTTQLAMSDSFTMNSQEVTVTTSIMINHSPLSTDGSLYKGRIVFQGNSSGIGGVATNCTNCSSITMASTVVYSKETESSINVRARYAMFGNNPALSDIINANGELDFTKKYDQAGALPTQECPGTTVTRSTTGWSDDGNELTLNINPQTKAVVASAAWQAGRNDCNTRVFNAKVSPQSDGSATGVAYFGFGPDLAASSDVGEISGMICNWAGPGSGGPGQRSMQSLAQKQVISLNTTTGVFEPTSSNIKYAPTNSCNVSGSLIYKAVISPTDPTLIVMDNNNLLADAISNTLVNISDISSNFTMPTVTGDFSFD